MCLFKRRFRNKRGLDTFVLPVVEGDKDGCANKVVASSFAFSLGVIQADDEADDDDEDDRLVDNQGPPAERDDLVVVVLGNDAVEASKVESLSNKDGKVGVGMLVVVDDDRLALA